MRNLVCTLVGNLGISVHTEYPPSDEEWEDMIQVVRKSDIANFRGICFSDGGSPNSAQRKRMNDCLRGRAPATAVVTRSALARGVVIAMGWFNPNIRAFSPDEIDQALRHLKVSESEFGIIKTEVRNLAVKLGKPSLLSIPKNL